MELNIKPDYLALKIIPLKGGKKHEPSKNI